MDSTWLTHIPVVPPIHVDESVNIGGCKEDGWGHFSAGDAVIAVFHWHQMEICNAYLGDELVAILI